MFSELYDECFSEHSYGFRPNRSFHQAMEKVKDDVTLHLVRTFLRAGIMEDGIIHRNEEGVPQGGLHSPIST